MLKKTIAAFVILVMVVSLLPSAWITAEGDTAALLAQLAELTEYARPLLYKDNSEQTKKYLYDRVLRAEAALFEADADAETLFALADELCHAVDLLAPMKGSERVQLMSFDYITADDVALMTNNVGVVSVDTENKPQTAKQSLAIASDGDCVYDNSAGNGIVGASPFGMDMFDTDGLRLWVSPDAPCTLSLTIGKLSDGESFSLTASDIPVSDEGYLTIPYYMFIPDADGAEINTNGLMNHIRVECSGAGVLRVADLHAYRETVDVSGRTPYSEERVTSRGGIIDNVYYKLYSVDSYGTDDPKAVTMTYGQNATTFTLESAVEGDLKQLWQFTPDPSGNSTFRIVNKSTGYAMEMGNSSTILTYGELDYNDSTQEFALTASRGEFTLQVRGVAKLTYAGSTVKGTASNTFKKFVVCKVNDGDYIQTWSDEFDGDKLDSNIWRADTGFFFGGTNTSLYIDSEETAFLEDGDLVLRTLNKDHNGYESVAPHILSSGKYAISYGRVEIRAKMPHGFGMWPAIWMMPVDSMNMARSEIDLMEMPVTASEYGGMGDKLYARQIGTLHWTNPAGTEYMDKRVDIYSENYEALSNDYHTYAVELDTDQVRLYFDGALIMSLNLDDDGKKFAYGDVARYIILSSGGIEGITNAVLDPNEYYGDREMRVDYVRAYIRSEQGTDDTPDFTSEYSVVGSRGVEYLGRDSNFFMSSFPMDVSPDGTQGVMADQSGILCVYDPRTGETLQLVPTTTSYRSFITATYSPDGGKFAAGTMNGSVLIYDTSDFSKAPVRINNGATMHYCLTFTKDGGHLIAGGFNGGAQTLKNPNNSSVTKAHYIRVFNADTGALENELFIESDPLSADLSPDGTKLAVTTTSAGVFIFNTADWSEYAHFTTEHVNTVQFCRFSPDGSLLATSDEAGEVVLWSVADKNAVRRLDTVNESSVRKLAWSPDGKRIVTTSTDSAARVYSVESGRCVSLLGGFAGQIHEVAYSPDGRFVAAASLDRTMKLYYADGTYVSTLLLGSHTYSEGHISSKICFTPDSRYIYASSYSFPSCVNRWELPAETDKSALKAAIDACAGKTPALDNARKVYAMKYASAKAAAEAVAALTGEPLPAPFGAIAVSADGVAFGNSASIYRNGRLYVTVEVSRASSAFLAVKKGLDDPSIIPIDSIKLSSEDAGGGYIRHLLGLHPDEGGEYTVYLTDSEGNVSESASVFVSDVSTTRDFFYTVSDGKVTITGAKCGGESVNIPDYIDGYPVTAIGDYAFQNYGQTVLHMKLSLPRTLKSIGNYAFYECTSLEELNLPEGLESIGAYAFGRCLSLSHIDIPSSVKTVGSDAFYYARGTSYIRVGGGLANVPGYTFYMTVSNRCFIFDEGVKTISSYISYPARLLGRVYVPRSVTSINGSFAVSMLGTVKLYGYPGTYAETFAANNASFEFVPLAAPVISGVKDGGTYDLFDGPVAASWDDGHIAYLNGKTYYAGGAVTEPGEYTLKVINGYEEFTTEVSFTVVDTTPVKGDADGDGVVTVSDALLTLRAAAKLYAPTAKVTAAIDLDADGEITVADALDVLRMAVGL
ncbi:MAG: leucine-rich repeat protein [Clostridia bacterium]|nr:leucine-rich repeat protein [Clostridia bacterium]